MNSPRFLLSLLLFPWIALAQTNTAVPGDAEADWNTVLALEAGPQTEILSRDQARAVSLAHLAKQEAGLRDFIRKYPGTTHVVDAQLRLAHLLSTRSDLSGDAVFFTKALQVLTDALKTAPEERRADLEFAKIALAMHHFTLPTDHERDALLGQMNAFLNRYPNDRRAAALMVEIATLFDNQPRRKDVILQQALAAARSPELRGRIQDDMKRTGFLGGPIDVRGTTADGAVVDLAKYRGKVALVYFFASWSPPSVAGLDEVEYLRKTFAGQSLEVIGVSLDPNREALEATLKPRRIAWPVIFDGKGWRSPLVRGLAINAIPTLWVVDRKGNLRTLNARTESEALVRELIKER